MLVLDHEPPSCICNWDFMLVLGLFIVFYSASKRKELLLELIMAILCDYQQRLHYHHISLVNKLISKKSPKSLQSTVCVLASPKHRIRIDASWNMR